jgi:hypothetical protein
VKLTDTGPLVEARELLLDALANYDAELRETPRLILPEDGPYPSHDARVITQLALFDACVMHDLWPVWDYPEDNPGWRRDTIGLDDYVAAHEYAVEILTEEIDTGRRPSVKAL